MRNDGVFGEAELGLDSGSCYGATMNFLSTRTRRLVIISISWVCLWYSANVSAGEANPGRFQSCLANHLGLAVLDTCTGQVWDVYTGGVNDPKSTKVDGLPTGRFQWPVSMGNLPDAYVIDTVTGRVWQSKDADFHGAKVRPPIH